MLDKTGTVTEGKMELADVVLLNGATRADVLRLAGAVEAASRASDRAGGRAAHARAEVGDLPAVSGFRQRRPGVGVSRRRCEGRRDHGRPRQRAARSR